VRPIACLTTVHHASPLALPLPRGRCGTLRGCPPSAPLSQGFDKRPHLVTVRASEDLIATGLPDIAVELCALILQRLAANVAGADGPPPDTDFVNLRGRDLVGGVNDWLATRRQNGGNSRRPGGLHGLAGMFVLPSEVVHRYLRRTRPAVRDSVAQLFGPRPPPVHAIAGATRMPAGGAARDGSLTVEPRTSDHAVCRRCTNRRLPGAPSVLRRVPKAAKQQPRIRLTRQNFCGAGED
jgi:hypothetical protein